MSAKYDGGPAYPSTRTLHIKHEDGAEETGFVEMRGLTLRDWFAGQALAGILMNYTTTKFGVTEASVSLYAYRYADALLAERSKP